MKKIILLAFSFTIFSNCFAGATYVYGEPAKIKEICDGGDACTIFKGVFKNKKLVKTLPDYTIYIPNGLEKQKEEHTIAHEVCHAYLELAPLNLKVFWMNLFKRQKNPFCATDLYLDSRYKPEEKHAECFAEVCALVKTKSPEFWGVYRNFPEMKFALRLLK